MAQTTSNRTFGIRVRNYHNAKTICLLCILVLIGCNYEVAQGQRTICNPLDLNYRFCIDTPSRREAADPTIVLFKETYFLFASKSGGYWYSSDLIDWTFIATDEIPSEEYAPTAVAINDTLYFIASNHQPNTIYKSANPLSGKWSVALKALEIPVWDPAFYLDNTNRLYLYWGCSDKNPLYGVEVDYSNNFSFIGEPKALIYADTLNHGWEIPGDYNNKKGVAPWIEGAWMNKYNGKYYLQYSGPGTEYKSYCDGVYTSENPLGPFTLAENNPFAYKPEGFAAGAGHGSTFKDKYGNFWHIGTSTISVKHMFERRLVLNPVFFDKQGAMHASTRFGDYPFSIPNKKITNHNDIFPSWMLLSYNKTVEVSSTQDGYPIANMTDEDMRTYWAAQSNNSDEYAIIDLNKPSDVYAVQINFAEHNTQLLGRQKSAYHRYTIEYSTDKTSWEVLIDESENMNDNSHDYTQLNNKIKCRYLKYKNIEIPDGELAISGFRVFGINNGATPDTTTNLRVTRNTNDRRRVRLEWNNTKGAIGYNIVYGSNKNKLYQNYMVYQDTTVEISSLDANQSYYFTLEAFNESGVTNNKSVVVGK